MLKPIGVKAGDAAELRGKLHQSAINADTGGRFLSDLLRQFNGQIELALATYNAEEGAVKRAGNRIPDYPETRQYVAKVLKTLERLKAGEGQAALPVLVPASVKGLLQAIASTTRVHQTLASAPVQKPGIHLLRADTVEIARFEHGFGH